MRVLLRREILLRVSVRYSPQIHKTWGYNRLLVRTNFKREARKASLMRTHRSYFYCVWRRWRGVGCGKTGRTGLLSCLFGPLCEDRGTPGVLEKRFIVYYSGRHPVPPVSAVSLPLHTPSTVKLISGPLVHLPPSPLIFT